MRAALLEPDAIALYRLLVADGWCIPDLARVFDQSGMRVIRRSIHSSTGQVAAEVVALALGDAYQRASLGMVEARDREAFARQIEAAVMHGMSRIT